MGLLLMSADQGVTWDLKPLGPLTTLPPVQSVRVSPDGERLWVVSLRGLVFSTDGGKTWAWHDLPLDSGGAISLDVDHEDENTMISIARNGLYISRDGGKSWQQSASGLPAHTCAGLHSRRFRFSRFHEYRRAICFFRLRPHVDPRRGHARRRLLSSGDDQERRRRHLCCQRNGGLYAVEWTRSADAGLSSPRLAGN